jgi:hypothetical protein
VCLDGNFFGTKSLAENLLLHQFDNCASGESMVGNKLSVRTGFVIHLTSSLRILIERCECFVYFPHSGGALWWERAAV